MSVARLTGDERATYLIGLAFRQFLMSAPDDDPMREAVWKAYVAVLDRQLADGDHVHVMTWTGLADESWMVDPHQPKAESLKAGRDLSDEIPW